LLGLFQILEILDLAMTKDEEVNMTVTSSKHHSNPFLGKAQKNFFLSSQNQVSLCVESILFVRQSRKLIPKVLFLQNPISLKIFENFNSFFSIKYFKSNPTAPRQSVNDKCHNDTQYNDTQPKDAKSNNHKNDVKQQSA
jgi:hypothetical protein